MYVGLIRGLLVLLGGLGKVGVRPWGTRECLCCCLGVCHPGGGKLEWVLGRLGKPSGSVRDSTALGVSHGYIYTLIYYLYYFPCLLSVNTADKPRAASSSDLWPGTIVTVVLQCQSTESGWGIPQFKNLF